MNTQESYWSIIDEWETLEGWEGDLYDDREEGNSVESPVDDVVAVIDLVWFVVMQDFRKVMVIHEDREHIHL